MSSRVSTAVAAALLLGALLACKTKKGVASSIQEKLPHNPSGYGKVSADKTRCEAIASGNELKITCNPLFLKGMVSESNEQIDTLLTVECESIVKAGFLSIRVEWFTTNEFRTNAAPLLKGKDGKPNCSVKPP
ncbi:MAG: hypothetical protein IT377_13695 [Polyangiaceae bacterium]|nr:hypothetical protein [Polyangiaceae bacterium]